MGSMLRWEDCVNRDVRKAGEEEDWKKNTRDRGRWKRLSDEVAKKVRQHLTPDKVKRGRERERVCAHDERTSTTGFSGADHLPLQEVLMSPSRLPAEPTVCHAQKLVHAWLEKIARIQAAH